MCAACILALWHDVQKGFFGTWVKRCSKLLASSLSRSVLDLFRAGASASAASASHSVSASGTSTITSLLPDDDDAGVLAAASLAGARPTTDFCSTALAGIAVDI